MRSLFILILLTAMTASLRGQNPETGTLNVPPEYEEMGRLMYGGYDYVYDAIKAYADSGGILSNQTIDSLSQEYISAYYDRYPVLKEYSLNTLPEDDLSIHTDRNDYIQEIKSVTEGINSDPEFYQIRSRLGDINRRATENLTEKEVSVVYGVSVVFFYSLKYWKENITKWSALRTFPRVE